jgi:hypothetical protein
MIPENVKTALKRYALDKLEKAYEDASLFKDEFRLALSVLLYIPYEQLYRGPDVADITGTNFSDVYKICIWIINLYYGKLYGLDPKSRAGKTVFQHLFTKYLYQNDYVNCDINEGINIVNWNNESATVELDGENKINFLDLFEKCISNSSFKFITVNLLLVGGTATSDHNNTLIISKKYKCIWRIEPNFDLNELNEEAKKQFYIDNLKTGNYPFYTDYVNQALDTYFKRNPLIINGENYRFVGYHSTISAHTCSFHGGLCMAASILNTFYKQSNLTRYDLKYHIVQYFIWEYKNIYHEEFTLMNIQEILGNIGTLITMNKFNLTSPDNNIKTKNIEKFLTKINKLDLTEFTIVVDISPLEKPFYNFRTDKLYLSDVDTSFLEPIVSTKYF